MGVSILSALLFTTYVDAARIKRSKVAYRNSKDLRTDPPADVENDQENGKEESDSGGDSGSTEGSDSGAVGSGAGGEVGDLMKALQEKREKCEAKCEVKTAVALAEVKPTDEEKPGGGKDGPTASQGKCMAECMREAPEFDLGK